MSSRPSPSQDPMILSAILGAIGSRGVMSRAELARVLSVSSAAVTQACKVLLARGLLSELDTVPSGGGRPARQLGLAGSAGTAIGVKITADHLAVVQAGLDGTIENAVTVPFAAERPDAIDRLAHALDEVIGAFPGRHLGIGIGVPGSVDTRASGIVEAPTLGWSDAQVGPILRARTGLPVLVDNDVNTIAVADRLYGVGRNHQSYLVVTIGRGTGCGVVIDGAVYRGAAGGAGEIGHTRIDVEGPVCSCGARGCLDQYIGDPALVRTARERGVIGERDGHDALVAAARAGDPGALDIFATAGRLLGHALANVVQVLDPEVVVLLGEGVDAWSFWEDSFEFAFRANLMPSRRGMPFLVEPWTDDRWALGAATLVLSAPFDTDGIGGEQGRLVRARLRSGDTTTRQASAPSARQAARVQ